MRTVTPMNGSWFAEVILCAGILAFTSVDSQAGPRSLLSEIEEEIATILDTNRAGVVRIHTLYSSEGDDSGLQFGKAFTHGTGFVFDTSGHVVTTEGAVRGAEQILVTTHGGQQMRAIFVASDPVSEVAVIRVENPPADLPVLTLGNSDKVRVGHYAFVLGNTFGTLSPSFGSVHEIHRDPDLLQIRASVHPGFGGAPVFCSTGEVIGMVWAEPDPGASEQAPGFSSWQEAPSMVLLIPINRAARIARRLVNDGQMAYGGLGVEIEQRERGVLVTWVQPSGPAFQAGWKKGDLILSFEGRPVAGAYHLRRMVNETAPGTSVLVEIERGDTPVIASVRVGEMPSSALGLSRDPTRAPDLSARRLAGLEQELGGLRLYMEGGRNNLALTQQVSGPGSGAAVSQQIDQLEREIGRLRRILHRR